MANFPALPLFVREFLTDTTHLTLEEAGAYLHLLMHSWNRAECSLPDDDKKLAAWCKLSVDEWLKIRPELEPFFDRSGGAWQNKRLLKEFEYVKQQTLKRKAAGKKGGIAKSLNNNKNKPSNALANVKQCSSNALAPTPTPTHIEKIYKKENSITEYSAERQKTKITQAWMPSEDAQAYCRQKGLDTNQTVAEFINHHTSKGTWLENWNAGFQSWCDKAAHFGKNNKRNEGTATRTRRRTQ